MHFRTTRSMILSILFTLLLPGLICADEFTLALSASDSLSGWQQQGSAKFERSGETITFSGGESEFCFDYPLHNGTWSFQLQTPAGFQGSIQAKLESGKESHLLEIMNSETALAELPEQTVVHQFDLSDSEIKWNRGESSPVTHSREEAVPLKLSLKLNLTGETTVQISNLKVVERGYQSLFNGTDLTGWEGGGQPADVCWKVEEGLLTCTGLKKGPWLRTSKEYGDFNLRIEYWLSEGGNSGLYVRVPEDGNHHRENKELPEAGFEIQLLDDNADQYKGKLKDYQYTGSVYDIVGANAHVGNPPGHWNTLELNCKGQHITTIHNGKMIVNATADVYPLLNLRKTEGYLGLQNHSSVVKFRNLRLGPALDY